MSRYITLANKEKKKPEQKLPVWFLLTLLYTFLVSVSPGTIIFFLRKVDLKFWTLSNLFSFKSKAVINFTWMTHLCGVFLARITLYRQKSSFRTLSYERKNCHINIHALRICQFFLCKLRKFEKLCIGKKFLSFICFCGIFFLRRTVSTGIYTQRKHENFNI